MSKGLSKNIFHLSGSRNFYHKLISKVKLNIVWHRIGLKKFVQQTLSWVSEHFWILWWISKYNIFDRQFCTIWPEKFLAENFVPLGRNLFFWGFSLKSGLRRIFYWNKNIRLYNRKKSGWPPRSCPNFENPFFEQFWGQFNKINTSFLSFWTLFWWNF